MNIANSINNYPDAFITINKNRVRIYNHDSIFFKHNTEFEIEFDNRTTDTWLAKIKLNGEWTSDSGLVLRPGEHVFLDTPNLNSLDKNRFLFETYKIEKDHKIFIKNNGLVEIIFYRKIAFIDWNLPLSTSTPIIITTPPIITTTPPIITTPIFGTYICSSNDITNDMEETGRIADGQKSNQNFHTMNEEFESFSSHSIHYKILPKKKQLTIQEIVQYCSECGRRRRKNQNFCPSCGKKF